MTSDGQLMSLPEVAEYLGMAERTIYLWAQQGKIPAFKLGSSWRFRRVEIDTWLESQRSGPDVSSSRQPLVDRVDPPMPKSMRKKAEQDALEQRIAECIEAIENTFRLEDATLKTFESFLERFDADIFDTAVDRLVKEKRYDVGTNPGLSGEKVRVIKRRN